MLYTVAEISELTNLSKVSIYKKLKLKDLEQYISKKQGTTYIDEVGLSLIKEGLNFNTEGLKSIKNKDQDNTINADIAIDTEDLSIKEDYINTLKEQLKIKDTQIQEKDNQIKELHQIVQNSQILLKDKPQQNILELEEHFTQLDNKLMEIQEHMGQRKKDQEQNIFSRLFKK